MYLVACKWLANGELSYKKPMDYFLSLAGKDTTDPINQAILEYAISFENIAHDVKASINQNILAYYWLDDPDSLNKITMTYYVSKEQFDEWNASDIHTAFLENRNSLLNATGISLQIVEKEVADPDDSSSFATANQLFLG